MLRLPSPLNLATLFESSLNTVAWVDLTQKVRKVQEDAGKGDKFQETKLTIERMAKGADFDGLKNLLKTKIAGRAMSQVLVEGSSASQALLNQKTLTLLEQSQTPRLGRIVLINLFTVYFKKFDLLDEQSSPTTTSLFNFFTKLLKNQLALLPKKNSDIDVLQILKANADWLLNISAPSEVVSQARSNHQDLDDYLDQLGIRDITDGRFSDICRSSYYLQTIKEIPVGDNDPVLSEIQKTNVCYAPYEDGKTIGLAALEIMIDRASEAPGEFWEKTILSIAGDPRISERAKLYREWWTPLGIERVRKVRSWLAKADLKLFLRALEEYGVVTGNQELQRMFPARKVFLEGLLSQGVIRDSRLMLGHEAKKIVERILDNEFSTAYMDISGTNNMGDKSVLYLDCGDFHLIEGSHNFKIWVYLEKPSDLVTNFNVTQLSHFELTTVVPKEYRQNHPGLPYKDVIHTSQWQNRVIQFLADNGVSLDIEKLFNKSEYKAFIRRHGIPVVKSKTRR